MCITRNGFFEKGPNNRPAPARPVTKLNLAQASCHVHVMKNSMRAYYFDQFNQRLFPISSNPWEVWVNFLEIGGKEI